MKFLLRLVFFFLLGWGNLYAQSNLPPCPSSGYLHNCFGTFTFASGNKYVGEWKDDKYNGQGTLTHLNGDKYVGAWSDDRENGYGTYTYSYGDKYVGEFKDGKFNGQGTVYNLNGSIRSQGIYANDNFVRSAPVQQATAPNSEIERLRAEAEEAKRKQVEAEAQLRLAQQTIQTSLTLASVKGFGLSACLKVTNLNHRVFWKEKDLLINNVTRRSM